VELFPSLRCSILASKNVQKEEEEEKEEEEMYLPIYQYQNT